MKIILLIVLLVALSSSSKVNTTGFFQEKLGHQTIYQTYSGYEDIDWYYPSGSAAMYYSFFQSIGSQRNFTDKNVPLILWLEGGPGASSQRGAFNMVGPLSIRGSGENFTMNQNSWPWSIYGHMIFLDQPLDVGFSYNKNEKVSNSYDAAHHVVNFLHNFYEEWGLRQNPLYITGLSYAGHIIPAIARNIITNISLEFNLKGIMMGGAWVHPEVQVNFVDSFMYSVGILSESGRSTTSSIQNQAIVSILNEKYSQAGSFANWIHNQGVHKSYFGGVDFSNYRHYDQNNTNPHYGDFLQANKKEFGVAEDVSFKGFNSDIYNSFVSSGDFARSMGDEIDFILNRGLKTLFFNGQNDVQVPTASVLTFLNTIEWHDLSHWQRTQKQPWNLVFTPGGWVKKYSNLAFVFVQEAGHLTPADQPRACLTILNNFIHGIW